MFGKVSQKITKKRHSTLENAERNGLDKSSRIGNAGLAETSCYGYCKTVHGFYNGNDDNFDKTHGIKCRKSGIFPYIMGIRFKILLCVFALFSGLFALDIALPEVTPELKSNAREFFDDECKGCHRWARKFAAPPMQENVAQYESQPENLVKYLMHPTPKHPDEWPAMDITPLTEPQAKMMTAWLLYILHHADDPTRPK